MIVKQNITKQFCSYELTDYKYQSVKDYASFLLIFKNKISEDFNSNVLKYLNNFSASPFVTFCRSRFPKELSSNFDHQLYEGVYNDYDKKFEQVRHNLDFHYLKFKKWNLKNKTVNGRKFQYAESVKFIKQSNDLTKVLNFIVKYGSEDMLNWCSNKLNDNDLNVVQRNFYQNFFRIVNKFGFERLYSLAMMRKDRIMKLFENPICYKSLTFRGRCNRKDFIGLNKNKHSIIDGFITISIPIQGKNNPICIPVKLSTHYHGSLKDYNKSNNVYLYTICFNEKRKRLNISICKTEDKTYYNLNDSDEVIGIDTNVKHNLFALSDGTTYLLTDQMQQTIDEYLKLCLKEDELRKKHDESIERYIQKVENEDLKTLTKKEKTEIKKENPFKAGKKLQFKKDALKRSIIGQENDLMSQICKDLQQKGIHHVAMEDLDTFGQSFIKMKIKKTDSDEEKSKKIKFNRLVKFIGLSDLNNRFENISRKYDILVSKVHAAYTSQMCNECGFIDKDNRKTQENFLCLECDFENNADINAAKNIKDRVSEVVLREGLLIKNDLGSFSPKKKSNQDILDFLSSPAVQSLFKFRTASSNKNESSKRYLS